MGKYFGTDGFRGKAGTELTAYAAFRTGRYLGYHLAKRSDSKPRVVIGKDTRLSSYMLEYSISAGLTASGADVYLLHVTTTPSVSYTVLNEGFDCGVMITASHNPYYDNGIKIIDERGEKLDDATASLIEAYIDGECEEIPLAEGEGIGKIHDHYSGRNRYIAYLISLASNSYKGLKIGIDSANGAAFAISRSVFGALGAEVHSICDDPSGINVNDNCGATNPQALVTLVKEKGLDVGFAFDGDADRCIAVDENGEVVDGDKILYALANRLKRLGMLGTNTVVSTVMSNSGFKASMESAGIRVEQTRVGDRFVYERMQKTGAVLGGEQSGHVIIKKYATTGDGILTAIMLTEEICNTKSSLHQLTKDVVTFPQRTVSLRVADKRAVATDMEIKRLTEKLNDELSPRGRLIIRESGTEPKIRIMVEAEAEAIRDECIEKIISLLKDRGHIDV